MNAEIPDEANNYLRDCDREKFDAIKWDARDWEIFYHCIGFAMFKIANRKDRCEQAIDYQI